MQESRENESERRREHNGIYPVRYCDKRWRVCSLGYDWHMVSGVCFSICSTQELSFCVHMKGDDDDDVGGNVLECMQPKVNVCTDMCAANI